MRRIRWVFLFVCVAVNGPAAETAGDVIQIEGTWFAGDSTTPLLAGESVAAGALIKADAAKGQGYVVVALLNKKQLSAACRVAPCSATLQIPADGVAPDITFKNILAAVQFVLLHRGPQVAAAYDSTSSRGPEAPRSEMLLPFDSTRNLDFAPELKNLSDGKYDVTVLRVKDQRIDYSGETQWEGTNLKVAFTPGASGLYVVLLKNRLGVISADILLDLVPPANYEKVRAAFTEAERASAQWTEPEGTAAAHLFRRTYLLALEENQ